MTVEVSGWIADAGRSFAPDSRNVVRGTRIVNCTGWFQRTTKDVRRWERTVSAVLLRANVEQTFAGLEHLPGQRFNSGFTLKSQVVTSTFDH